MTQLGKSASMYDSEKRLPSFLVPSLTPFRPEVATLHSPPDALHTIPVGRAFIEDHDNISAQLLLDFDGKLGCQKMLAAVNMGAEQGTFVADAAKVPQAEHLKTAAIT